MNLHVLFGGRVMRGKLFASVVILAGMTSSMASAALVPYDDFNDGVWDNSRWTRTSTSLVTEGSGVLQVNGSGGTQEALSTATFTPMSPFARYEFVQVYQGGNDELFGLYSGGG